MALSTEKLLARNLAELRRYLLDRELPVPDGFLQALEHDPRNGARQLALLIRKRRLRNRREGQRLRHLLRF